MGPGQARQKVNIEILDAAAVNRKPAVVVPALAAVPGNAGDSLIKTQLGRPMDIFSSALAQAQIDLDPYQFMEEDDVSGGGGGEFQAKQGTEAPVLAPVSAASVLAPVSAPVLAPVSSSVTAPAQGMNLMSMLGPGSSSLLQTPQETVESQSELFWHSIQPISIVLQLLAPT